MSDTYGGVEISLGIENIDFEKELSCERWRFASIKPASRPLTDRLRIESKAFWTQ